MNTFQAVEEKVNQSESITHIRSTPSRRPWLLPRNIFLVMVFLLPIFILPTSWIPLAMTKMTILALGVLTTLVLWLIHSIRGRSIEIPHTHILGIALLLVVGYFISAILSGSILNSLIGFGFEIDTVLAMFVFVGALFATVITMREVRDFMLFQKTLLLSFALLGIFQIIRIVFGGAAILPGIFSNDATVTLLGSWNDLAVFSGLVVIIALTGLALFSAKIMRWGLYGIIAIALFLLAVVNMSSAWIALTVVAFALAIYIFSDSSYDKETGKFSTKIPFKRLVPSVVVILIGVIFLVSGAGIGAAISKTLNVSYVDIRPSWQGTMAVGSGVYGNNMIFGTGPNTFSRAWITHKPAGINQTNFWNTNFSFGIGLIPTAFVTDGIVVGLLWILFFAAFLYLGARVLMRRMHQPALMYITVSAYIGATYLWILSIIYVPQTVMLAYAFILTGVAVAAAYVGGVLKKREVRAEDSYASGLTLTAITVSALLLIAGVYVVYTDRIVSSLLLSQSVRVANTQDYIKAEKVLARAVWFGKDIRVARLKTDISSAQLGAVLKEKKSKDAKAQKERFQKALAKTIGAAQGVVAQDTNDYTSWLLLGDIYSQLMNLKIKGADTIAIQAYKKAWSLNTQSPLIPIKLAQLAFAQKDMKEATKYTQAALKLKSNYTDAYYILSQIAIQEKNTKAAITATEQAAVLRPNNAGLLFQLGVLQYSVKDYKKAIPVFERAITINPNYSNALYFLGLAYDKTGNSKGALAAFKRIAKLNPKNENIKKIVVVLESGKSAFSAIQTKQPSQVQTSTLPIKTK